MACTTHIAQNGGTVVVGPYPVKEDLGVLKDHGITKIVSLLDSADAYEDTLLLREARNARALGIVVENYPLPRDSTRPNYNIITDAAATAIERDGGKIYLHSYLTSTRTLAVEKQLKDKGIQIATYILPRKAGSELTYALDSAQAAYQASHFEEVLAVLKNHVPLDHQSQLLRAWATYHLNQIPEAKAEFDTVLSQHHDDQEANIGLGYCEYRLNNLPVADSLFSYEIGKHADDPSANAGLGLTRYAENKLEDAQRYLTTSLKSDSINVEAGNLLLKINAKLGTPQLAHSARPPQTTKN